MIKIFRKVRQHHIKENNISKYLGEFKINSKNTIFNEEKGYDAVTFKIVENKFYVLVFGGIENEIFPHTENVFIFDDYSNDKISFIQDEHGQITGFQLFNNSIYTDWTSVK